MSERRKLQSQLTRPDDGSARCVLIRRAVKSHRHPSHRSAAMLAQRDQMWAKNSLPLGYRSRSPAPVTSRIPSSRKSHNPGAGVLQTGTTSAEFSRTQSTPFAAFCPSTNLCKFCVDRGNLRKGSTTFVIVESEAREGDPFFKVATIQILSRSAGWASSSAFPQRTENLLRAF
jgi:hypothetical protein